MERASSRTFACDVSNAASRAKAMELASTGRVGGVRYSRMWVYAGFWTGDKEREAGDAGDRFVQQIAPLLETDMHRLTHVEFWFLNLSDASAEPLRRVLERNGTIDKLVVKSRERALSGETQAQLARAAKSSPVPGRNVVIECPPPPLVL